MLLLFLAGAGVVAGMQPGHPGRDVAAARRAQAERDRAAASIREDEEEAELVLMLSAQEIE